MDDNTSMNTNINTNNQFDQEFRQSITQDILAANNQQKSSKKKYVIGIAIILVFILLVASLTIFFLSRQTYNPNLTALMAFYEKLDSEMSYGELEAKIQESIPDASIKYDEGMYIITADSWPESITFAVKTPETDKLMKDTPPADAEPIDTAALEQLVDEIMAEDDLDLDNYPEEEADESQIGSAPTIDSTTIVSYFTYVLFGEIKNGTEDNIVAKLSIQSNYNGDGFYYSDGTSAIWFPTKTDAINVLIEDQQ